MRILSLDGGGYLGLATAAFFEETERHFNTTCHNRFDLFCGTSTGAIIALAFASGLRGKEICDLYRSFGPQVFHNPFPGVRSLRKILGLVTSQYGNAALRAALTDCFGDRTLGDLHRLGKFVLIPAFSITTGTPRVFKTDHNTHLTMDDGYLIRDIALASSAAPVFLPLVEVRSPTTGDRERYCDGGMFANHPALLGYSEAIYEFGSEPSQIQILSASTPRTDLAEYRSATGRIPKYLLSRGLFIWRTKVVQIMIDSTSCITDEILRRIVASPTQGGLTYERITFPKPRGIDLDIATNSATETLCSIGYELARQSTTRSRLKTFFE